MHRQTWWLQYTPPPPPPPQYFEGRSNQRTVTVQNTVWEPHPQSFHLWPFALLVIKLSMQFSSSLHAATRLTYHCTWSERWTAPAPVRWPPSPDKSQQQLRMSCCQQWRCMWRCRVCVPSVDKTPSAWCHHSQSAECWRSLLTLPERQMWGCWERGMRWRQRGQTQTGSGSWQLESLCCCSEVCLVKEKDREQKAWISSHWHLIIKKNTAQEDLCTATHLSHGLV